MFMFSHPSLLHGYYDSFKLIENNHIFYLDITFYAIFYLVLLDLVSFSRFQLKNSKIY